jgi:hypothetical protein
MLYGTPGPARIGPPELSRFFELIKVEHLQSVIRIADQIPEPVNIKERLEWPMHSLKLVALYM